MFDDGPLRLHTCTIDLLTRYVRRRDGSRVRLTTKEADLLGFLAARPGVVVSRETLLSEVWQVDARMVTRTIDTTVRRLRGKVERDLSDPEHVVSVHGQGYQFVPATAPPDDGDPLLGRDDDLATVLARLRSGALVTLCGLGGIGKTRLARALAAKWPGPSVFVALEGHDDPLAAFVDASEPTESAARAAVGARGGCLWVLDNAEHLRDPLAPLLERLRDACPDAAWLVTSRVPLGVLGEETTSLGPLDDEAAHALFARHAQAVASPLVRALQGVPLALELAAQLTAVLTPEQLLARTERWLDLLADDTGARPQRQHSVRASLDISWEMLGEEERRVWCLLGCLRAPASLELVERVLGAGAATVLALGRLQRAGLVRRDADDHWGMLDLVRQYGRQRATEAHHARVADVLNTHALALVDGLDGERPGPVLRELAALRPDLEAMLEGSDPVAAGRAVVALAPLWERTGARGLADAREHVAACLPHLSGTLALRVRRVGLMLGTMRVLLDREPDALIAEADALHQEALAAGQLDEAVFAAVRAFELRSTVGPLAPTLVEDTLARARDASPAREALALTVAAIRGDATREERRLRRAIRVARRGRATGVLLGAQERLANCLDGQGRVDEAEAAAPDLAVLTAHGRSRDLARELLRRAHVHRHLGQYDDALELAREVAEDPHLQGRPDFTVAGVTLTCWVLAETDRLDDAAALARDRLAWAERLGVTSCEASMHTVNLLLWLARGDRRAAAAHADVLEDLLADLRSRVVRPAMGALVALVRALRGSPVALPELGAPPTRVLVDLWLAHALASVSTSGLDERLAVLRSLPVTQTPLPQADLDAIAAYAADDVYLGHTGIIGRIAQTAAAEGW
jgi:DNA-binding winged helix-turn-helix (wHTH) protein/tetratricopeptide (TPR) repeat protein